MSGGGAIYVENAKNVSLRSSTFSSNSATMGGGVFVQDSEAVAFSESCAFSGNEGEQDNNYGQGGAIVVNNKKQREEACEYPPPARAKLAPGCPTRRTRSSPRDPSWRCRQ